MHLGVLALVTVGELAAALKELPVRQQEFDLTAKVSYVLANASNTLIVAIQDATDCACLVGKRPPPGVVLKPGDDVRLSGLIYGGVPQHTALADIEALQILGHGPAPVARPATTADIADGKLDWRYLSIEGLVRDVYPSETSETFAILILADKSGLQRVNIPLIETRFEALLKLVGRRVRIRGFPNLNASSYRSFAGREFHCAGLHYIDVLDSEGQDPFNVTKLESLLAKTPEQIAASGRVKAQGLVVCTWAGGHALVRTRHSDIFQVICPPDSPLRRGDYVEASGFPLSDNFHITLTHVIWRPCPPIPIVMPPAVRIDRYAQITYGRTRLKAEYHGNPVIVCGRVRDLPNETFNRDTLLLEDDSGTIPVNVSSAPKALRGIAVGCEVEVTGTYVMEARYEQAGTPFSKAAGSHIVLNRPEDLLILRRPPWWTIGRLLAVICTLLTTLLIFLVWNIVLRRLAAGKGRELFREQLGHVKADLRTEERTRLAVELHDTLAQNLTGVSMEIEAANDLRGNAPKPMLDHLGIAAKALKSCRDELRNCLWDLRSQALEEQDMSKAVLRTLQPIINDSRLAVRFNVPRSRLSDNTAHTLLRVIRELVINAIRHGNANSIKVAGTIDQGKLLCSVTDNGVGFNPETAPGVLQGHFGLQGIQERIDEIGGTFKIVSAHGKGTKALIALTSPIED